MRKIICPLQLTNKQNKKSLIVKNITPTAESFIVRVFVDLDDADCATSIINNPHYLGEIYVYGFGQGIDKEDNIVVDIIDGHKVRKKADKFDAILDLEPLSKLYKHRPTHINLLFVTMTTDYQPLDDNLFKFEGLWAEFN